MPITVPVKLSIPFARDAAPANKNTIPNPSQIGSNPALASYTDGFPPLTMLPIASGGLNPYGQDFNGVLNAISSHTVWGNSGGRYKFDAAHAAAIGGYPIGAVLQSDDGQGEYASIVANNVTNFNTTPSSIGTQWRRYAGSALISAAPVYSEDEKWDLLPVGHVAEYFDFIVGFPLATWLASHTKWRSLSDYTGRLDIANTLTGTLTKGRVSALPSATRLPYSRFGDENAQLISHTHGVPATAHSHGYVDRYFVESFGGNLAVPGAPVGGSGSTDSDNDRFYTTTASTSDAVIPAQTTLSTGANNGTGENLQPTYFVPKIIKVLP